MALRRFANRHCHVGGNSSLDVTNGPYPAELFAHSATLSMSIAQNNARRARTNLELFFRQDLFMPTGTKPAPYGLENADGHCFRPNGMVYNGRDNALHSCHDTSN